MRSTAKETELADKQIQINQTQEEYNIAKSQEEQQHDDMVSRMRMMYENDSSENYVNLLLQGGGLSGMLNRMDFVESVYEYDRQKLQEYEETKEQVLALWNQLEEEKTQRGREENDCTKGKKAGGPTGRPPLREQIYLRARTGTFQMSRA